jgi:iron complex transport system substrate-binding protein
VNKQRHPFRFWHISIVLIIILINGCSDKSQNEQNTTGNSIHYAQNIKIKSTSAGHKVEIINPETKKTYKYLITSDAKQVLKGYQTIVTPIKDITVLSATHVGMLSKIDAIKNIRGFGNAEYVHNYDLKKQIQSGYTKTFGEEQSVSPEAIIQSKSKLVIHSGFGTQFTKEDELKKLGIFCIPNFEWKETNPLGKAEWIKFFGLLFQKETESNKYFSEVEKAYLKLKDDAKKYTSKPTVFAGNIFGDYWYTPAGNSFQAQFYKDASANYVYSNRKGVGSLAISLEQIIKDNSNTDIWLDPGNSSIPDIIKSHETLVNLKAYKTKHIYDYSQNINKYWELSASEPHHVLSDLIQIFHVNPLDSKLLYFYKKLD